MENQAIPFIVYQDKEGFVLTQEAKDFLSSLPKDKKIALISIVGKYRTGKSFLINRVLLNQQKKQGFSVGPTINPCTKVDFAFSSINAPEARLHQTRRRFRPTHLTHTLLYPRLLVLSLSLLLLSLRANQRTGFARPVKHAAPS